MHDSTDGRPPEPDTIQQPRGALNTATPEPEPDTFTVHPDDLWHMRVGDKYDFTGSDGSTVACVVSKIEGDKVTFDAVALKPAPPKIAPTIGNRRARRAAKARARRVRR